MRAKLSFREWWNKPLNKTEERWYAVGVTLTVIFLIAVIIGVVILFLLHFPLGSPLIP